jgi:hypothetical protein
LSSDGNHSSIIKPEIAEKKSIVLEGRGKEETEQTREEFGFVHLLFPAGKLCAHLY